jgi:uncharacterized protein (TIGR03382 family)
MRARWLLCAVVCACAAPADAPGHAPPDAEMIVLVTLRRPAPTVRAALAPERLHAVAQTNAAFAAGLDGAHARARRMFGSFAGGVVAVDEVGYRALVGRADVLAVDVDLPTHAHDLQSIPLIRANVTQAAGANGAGVAVAVLDTGVNPTHVDLADAVLGGGQHFLHAGADVGAGAVDDQGHGSNVAGIIASRGVVATNGPGVAPAARIVPVKVLDSAGAGMASDWVLALDWVVTNQNAFGTPIRVVNMSLGTTTRTSSCPCDGDNQTAMKMALDQLRAHGIVLVASSGNEGDEVQLPYPACFSTAIAVGATYDANLGRQPASGTYAATEGWPDCFDTSAPRGLACFTNRNACVRLVAPGSQITSDGFAGTTQLLTFIGTSQAAPHAAGVAAVLLGEHPDLTPEQVEHSLLASSTRVNDPDLAQSYAFVDAVDALAAAECDAGCAPAGPCDSAACNAAGLCQHTLATEGASCGDVTCAGGVRSAPTCDGAGACAPVTASCGAYQCDTAGADCLVTCVLQTDCADGFVCRGVSCVAAGADVGGGCQTAPGAPPWAALALAALLMIHRRRWIRSSVPSPAPTAERASTCASSPTPTDTHSTARTASRS